MEPVDSPNLARKLNEGIAWKEEGQLLITEKPRSLYTHILQSGEWQGRRIIAGARFRDPFQRAKQKRAEVVKNLQELIQEVLQARSDGQEKQRGTKEIRIEIVRKEITITELKEGDEVVKKLVFPWTHFVDEKLKNKRLSRNLAGLFCSSQSFEGKESSLTSDERKNLFKSKADVYKNPQLFFDKLFEKSYYLSTPTPESVNFFSKSEENKKKLLDYFKKEMRNPQLSLEARFSCLIRFSLFLRKMELVNGDPLLPPLKKALDSEWPLFAGKLSELKIRNRLKQMALFEKFDQEGGALINDAIGTKEEIKRSLLASASFSEQIHRLISQEALERALSTCETALEEQWQKEREKISMGIAEASFKEITQESVLERWLKASENGEGRDTKIAYRLLRAARDKDEENLKNLLEKYTAETFSPELKLPPSFKTVFGDLFLLRGFQKLTL